ncbi:MAG: hypothetical protein EHM39_07970 [Chloroflexi bacterium]|nr:MAG: hypothetical protein EHM39_07970 [Chloroflexota bacterium]
MASSDVILSYIERKGWQTEPILNGWHARHPEQNADLLLSFTPSWICLQAPLAGLADVDQRDLLLRNEMMFMAKIAVAPGGAPSLQVELPAANGIHLIDYALGALAQYRDPQANPLREREDRRSKELYFDEPPGIPHEILMTYIMAILPRGWGAKSKPKGITWPLKYKGQRLFDVYLTVSRSWAYFHAPVLPEAGRADPSVQAAFFEYLLSVNQVLYMAKLGIGEHDQALLMLEVPTQELDFDMFRLVTRMLGTYLDLYAREIQIMAHLHNDRRLMEKLGVC